MLKIENSERAFLEMLLDRCKCNFFDKIEQGNMIPKVPEAKVFKPNYDIYNQSDYRTTYIRPMVQKHASSLPYGAGGNFS